VWGSGAVLVDWAAAQVAAAQTHTAMASRRQKRGKRTWRCTVRQVAIPAKKRAAILQQL